MLLIEGSRQLWKILHKGMCEGRLDISRLPYVTFLLSAWDSGTLSKTACAQASFQSHVAGVFHFMGNSVVLLLYTFSGTYFKNSVREGKNLIF